MLLMSSVPVAKRTSLHLVMPGHLSVFSNAQLLQSPTPIRASYDFTGQLPKGTRGYPC
jgi:hypothetical protein